MPIRCRPWTTSTFAAASGSPVLESRAADSIAAAALKRIPVLWPRGLSPSRAWHAVLDWQSDEMFSELVPWAVARVNAREGGEFVLTAPQRGGALPLLHVAPPWEPLKTATRNVSVTEIFGGGLHRQLEQEHERTQQQSSAHVTFESAHAKEPASKQQQSKHQRL